MITAIIMASGLSKRMGENKLLLKYKDKTIIEYVLDEVSKVDFKEVIVVSSYNEIKEISKKYNFKYIENKKNYIGQSESIKLGINNSKESLGYMFFVGDQPLIDSNYINKMIEVFNENKDFIIIPRYKDKKGNPVIFPKSKRGELLRLKEDEKGKKVITNSCNIKYVDVSEYMLFDIDTKKDYIQLGGIYEKD
ncbi:molybdenum cofactor cytidylyltransferase [Romboutsia sp. 1001713B170131_170501_G6]|uniref:molybdenum cofactor cytidylyltransferase n=1 Tax=Romboutsia sp. 1001713B170131_170501_G6 TaxID=2787108 RepID=UPI0018AAF797|nr:molybdenum cofactor cytidylyltransferase [Romboutsia sp. 1001713B170131_170501_G6]